MTGSGLRTSATDGCLVAARLSWLRVREYFSPPTPALSQAAPIEHVVPCIGYVIKEKDTYRVAPRKVLASPQPRL